MKYDFTTFHLFLAICVVCMTGTVHGQKSSAELITTILPPKIDAGVQVNDGERHMTLHDNKLFISNYWVGLRSYDISDIKNPVQEASVQLDDEAYCSFADDRYIYIANDEAGVPIFELNSMKKVAQIKTPGGAHWVYAEFPYLYMALGDKGFCIMDISDINNPTTLSLEVPAEWVQQLTKKDNFLFLAAKMGGLFIYDVSQPAAPKKVSQFKTGFNTMEIQVVENLAYIADGRGGLAIINIANPRLPVQVSKFSNGGFISGIYKAGNYVYLANQNVGLQIVNVTDPTSPFLEGTYETEGECYNVFKKDIYVFLAANTATLIMRHNNVPILTDIPDLTLKEGEPFQLTLEASEPDGDPIVVDASNIPEGSSFDDATRTFSWTPTYEQSGTYGSIVFSVTEQTQSMLSVSDTITITVQHVNRLPDLPPIENQTIDENEVLTFEIAEGSDPDVEDQKNLRYLAENLPEGSSFDSTSRVFTWTPTYEQSGTYIVDFLLSDGAGGIDREPVTITVNHVDRKPEIDPVAEQEIDENQTLTVALSGKDLDKEDQDKISFRMENLPEGAVFDASTQKFTWTPTYDQSGSYEGIKAIMIAGNLSDTSSFAIKVNHVNRPPVMADVGDKTVDENQELTFSLRVSDPDIEDAGKLTVTTETLPSGATFDNSSYLFSWTPTFEQSGTYSGIGFIVTDPSGLSDRKSVSITVNHVNRPPQIEAAGDLTVNENEPVNIQLTASDPDIEDKDRLVFSANQLPDGAKLDFQTGLFQWTPTFDQSGVYDIFFIISDGEYTDSTFSRITVNHVNRPPQLAEIENHTVDENQPVSFTINGSDPDKEDEGKLAFTAENLPEGAVFDPAGLSFQWTPTYEQSGEYQISFKVADPAGLEDQKTSIITVNHVNRPPTLEPIPAQTTDENQAFTVQLTGADPDAEDSGKLVYQVTNLPKGATLDQSSGMITWTPAYNQAGEYQLTAQVADASGLQAEQSFTITVNNVNRPPVIGELAPQTGKETSSIIFTLPVDDPDREDVGKLNYSSPNLPEGATFSASTGEFFWTPTYEQSGTYQIEFDVTDSFGASDNTKVSVTVQNLNRPPAIEGIEKKSVKENQQLSFVLTATDADKEDEGKVKLRAATLPVGASFNANSGQFSWTPTFDQGGKYAIEFEATDGQGASVNESVLVDVENENRAPKINSPGNQSVKEGQTLEFKVTAADPDKEDKENLKFSSANLPSGAQLKESGTFSWTPGGDQQGSYDITFTVKDSGDLSDSVTITVMVEDVAPVPAPQVPQGP
jgi:hypothetical protein